LPLQTCSTTRATISALAPQLVQAEVDNDPGHPGAETGIALELRQPLPAFDPGFLRKIDRFFFIAHHAVSPSVNFVAMSRHQFLKGRHVASLGCPHQRHVFG